MPLSLIIIFVFEEHAESADECLRDLENHRALFAARFLPDTKFWIDWIQDKILNAGAACADLIELDELFQNAIFYCPNIEIVTEWVENSSHRYEGCLLVIVCLFT